MAGADSEADQRNFYCHEYSRCLDHAVAQGWDSWTCRGCPLLALETAKPRAQDFANDRRRGRD
jgi:hypothetical protein